MTLDGITYNGKVLRLRRVKDYELLPKVEGERPVPKLDVSKLAFQKISTMVCDGPLKVLNITQMIALCSRISSRNGRGEFS